MTQRSQLIRAGGLSESVAMLMKTRLLLLVSVASQLTPGNTSSPLSLLLDLKDRIFSFSDTQTTGLDQDNLENNTVIEPLFNDTEYENSTLDSEAVQGTRSGLEIRVNATDGNRLVEINEQDALGGISAFLYDTDTNNSQNEYVTKQELNYIRHQEINYDNKTIGNSDMANEDTNIKRKQETNTTSFSEILTDSLSLNTKNNTITVLKPKDSFDTQNIQITTTINGSSTEQNKQLDKVFGYESLDLADFVNAEIKEVTNSQSQCDSDCVNNVTKKRANNITELFSFNATSLKVPNVTVTGEQTNDRSIISNTSSFGSNKLQISNETKEITKTSSSSGSGKNETILSKKPIPDNGSKVSNQTTKIISKIPNIVNVLNNSTQIVERFIENITDSLATLNPEIETILNTANVEDITNALIQSNFTVFPIQILNTSTTVQIARNDSHINSQVEVLTNKNVTLGNVSSEFIIGTENGSDIDRIKRSLNLTFSWDEESKAESSENTVSAASKDLVVKSSLNLTDQLDTTGWNETTISLTNSICRAHDDEVVLQSDLNITSNPTKESDYVTKPSVTQARI